MGNILTGEFNGHADDAHVDWTDGDGCRVVSLGRERSARYQLPVTDHFYQMIT